MSDQKTSIDELTDKAELLEYEGRISQALEAWRMALQHYTTPYLLFRFGSLAMECAQWEDAERALLNAVDLAPSFPAPYTGLGILYKEQGNFRSAEAWLKKGLALEESAPTYTALGVAQRRLGASSAAIQSFKRAIEIEPEYEEAYFNLGIMFPEERSAEAIASFSKALELDPAYQEAHRELGWALRRLARYDEAEWHLKRAVELDNSDGWAHTYLGNLQWARGETQSAERAFKSAVEVWPDDSMTHSHLAYFYECLDRNDEAKFFYENALQLDPDDIESHLRFGRLLAKLGEAARAKMHLERVLALEPENEEARAALTALG